MGFGSGIFKFGRFGAGRGLPGSDVAEKMAFIDEMALLASTEGPVWP